MKQKFETLKSIFLKVMLGCLIAAAGVGVVTVLIGHFNSVAEDALWTIVLVAVHCLVSFGFIVNNEKEDTFDSLEFFTTVTFGLIILSFITSVLGVWSVISGDLVWKLYQLYFVLLFATLHAEILTKMRGKEPLIDRIVIANYFFMGFVVLMLIPIIFTGDNTTLLGSFYYRLLGALGIIDATLTLSSVILHKLYIRKHPMVNDQVFNMPAGQAGTVQPTPSPARRGMNIFVKILIAYVVLQLVFGLFFVIQIFASFNS
jgi:hypothetical protein